MSVLCLDPNLDVDEEYLYCAFGGRLCKFLDRSRRSWHFVLQCRLDICWRQIDAFDECMFT